MASSPLISKTSYHVRSTSLPSRPHPIADQLEEHLCRLRSSETTSTSSASASQRLSTLGDLYGCVDELILLPINQQYISQNHQTSLVDGILDGSLRLLDICGIARDALLQTKECIQEIQSVLRRRCSGELNMANEIDVYLSSRRKIKKAIKNCLKDIKKVDIKSGETSILKDVEAMTVDILKSLLIHIAGSEVSKRNGWSLVSKLVHQKVNQEVSSSSEFEDLDVAIGFLVCQKKKSGINMIHVDNLRNQMVKLESEIQDIDEALESLFRHLVRTRASLLNILSN